MGYYSFLCWFTWRLLMALLAHANWFATVYIKCIYFTLWKSYDLLWFWMHLLLCICFEPLRSENYLLVWCTLLYKKCTSSSHKSFRQIFNETYNRRFTKSERELKRIEIQEMNEDDSDSDDEDSTSNSNAPAKNKNIYPSLDYEEQSMPTLNISRKPNAKGPVTFRDRMDNEGLILDPAGEIGTDVNQKSKKKGLLKKAIPDILLKRVSTASENSQKSEAELKAAEEKAAVKAAAAEEKRKNKEEERQRKSQLKEIRQRRKEYLREQAKIERRRKLISDAIELLLQCLRLFTTFALLVGNVHKTFMPSYLIAEDHQLNNPDVMMLFTLTMGLDILMFWIMSFMTYCKQCRLCCRMGVCKFWIWFSLLIFLGGFCMYYPMHMAAEQLDMTWCHFEAGTPLSEIFY